MKSKVQCREITTLEASRGILEKVDAFWGDRAVQELLTFCEDHAETGSTFTLTVSPTQRVRVRSGSRVDFELPQN